MYANPAQMVTQSAIQRLVTAARQTYSQYFGTSVAWVNWRKDSCQIKLVYDDVVSFAVFVDFKFADTGNGVPYALRDAVLRALHSRHAKEKAVMSNDGKVHYCFRVLDNHISVQEVLDLAHELCPDGVVMSVYYMQESSCVRPYFEMLGRALVPGECGLKWSESILSGHKIEGHAFL